MKVINPIEASGYFWLPEDPQYKLPGTLSISEVGEAEIHITRLYSGGWAKNFESRFGVFLPQEESKTHDCVVGIIKLENSHENVTLEDCSYGRWSTPLPEGIATLTPKKQLNFPK